MYNMDMQERCELFDHLKRKWKRSDTISNKRIEDMVRSCRLKALNVTRSVIPSV